MTLPRRAAAAAQADPAADLPPPQDTGATNYFGRLVGYIPAEVIAVYQTVHSAVAGTSLTAPAKAGSGANTAADHPLLLWVGLGLLVFTPVWIWLSTTDRGEALPSNHMANATLAFGVWLIMVGNPVQLWLGRAIGSWEPYYGSVLMVLVVALFFPLVERIAQRFGPT